MKKSFSYERGVRVVTTGLLAGVAIFGVGGLMAIHLIDAVIGDVQDVSLVGTLRVLGTGGVMGVAGAFLYQAFIAVWRKGSYVRGAAFGILTFTLVAVLIRRSVGGTSESPWETLVVALVFGILFVLFALALEREDRVAGGGRSER